jgi:hypothetical protein
MPRCCREGRASLPRRDMKLRIVMPTLGQSRWWPEVTRSAAGIPEAERVVVCPVDPAGRSSETRWVRDSSAGLYAAVNSGLRAPGDWTLGTYLNDDDLLVPAGVQAAIQLLENERELGAVFGRVHLVDEQGARFAEIPVARRAEDLGPLVAAGIVPLAQPGTVFRRAVFESLGGFDEGWRAAGDIAFFLQAWRAGWKFAFVDAVVAEFRVHSEQISQQAGLVQREKTRLVDVARAVPEWRKAAGAAKWRFRAANLGVYFARLRGHGFVSMSGLQRAGRRQ